MIGQNLGHYRIVDKIGAGGMGEVYRAHDLQLDRDIALKVLPAGTVGDESARKQFRKEALALARLNHPCIATVHEFSTHDDLDFIAMELIPGATLDQMLDSRSLPEKDILRFGAQLAEGLSVAHEQGLVHRDLKPANLMVTPDGRLKILDFGLAQLRKPVHDIHLTQSISTTGAGAIKGTLPYMSPEQLLGLPVDARTDIYAAGAVLYEMATGHRAFPQSQSPELIGAILHQTPDPPSSRKYITPGLEQLIVKALKKDPGMRYQSARELHDALAEVEAGSPGIARRSHWVVVAGAGATVLLMVGVLLRTDLDVLRDRLLPGQPGEGSAGRAASIRSRRSIAVLGFKNVSGRADDAWLSTALSEMITTELAAGGQLRAVPGESVARMKISLALPDADSYGEDTLARIRTNLNADHVVLGSYIPLGGGQMRLDMRLQDTAAGEILLAASVKGDEAQIDNLVSRAGATLREKLGVGQVSPEEAVAVRATLPQSRDAARHYSIGLQRLRQFDYLRAQESLNSAVAAEPQFALAHSALAIALKGLGYDSMASAAAGRARDLSANFSREERLWIEGQSYEITNRWTDAIGTYRTLVDFFPDNLDYGLRLASAQIAAGKGKEALATVAALRMLPSPGTEDARIDLSEAAAAASLGDFKNQQALAATAVAKADAQGVRLLAAQARISDCSGLRYLGKPKESILRCEEAKRIFGEAGDRGGVARALNTVAVVHMEQGDLTDARRAYEEALSVARDIGDKKTEAMVLNNLAGALRGQADLAGSRKMLEGALASFRTINDKGGIARSLDNIGILLMDEGRPEAARKRYEESLAVSREIGNKSLTAYALYLLGEVHTVLGDLMAAKKSHSEAFTIRKEIGDERPLAQSDLALAGLLIEAAQFVPAESAARERMSQFQKVKATDDEALARAVLARALLAQGKIAEAREVSDQALALIKNAQDTSVRLTVAIEAARVRAASGDAADVNDAAKSLAAAAAEATREGLTGLLLEARLALGQVELKTGDRAGGRSRLAALQADASTKGYLLIARKAAAARR